MTDGGERLTPLRFSSFMFQTDYFVVVVVKLVCLGGLAITDSVIAQLASKPAFCNYDQKTVETGTMRRCSRR